jgi:hypothetical protein
LRLYVSQEEGRTLSAAHVFFQASCISRLTKQAALERLALESLAGMNDIPLVVFLRLWATAGRDHWDGGVASGSFRLPGGLAFRCAEAKNIVVHDGSTTWTPRSPVAVKTSRRTSKMGSAERQMLLAWGGGEAGGGGVAMEKTDS